MRQRDEHKILAAECALSLAEAVQKAGGGIDHKGMLSMSLGEFIACVAAQNHIRFFYDDPRKQEEEEPPVRRRRKRSRKNRERRPARIVEDDDIEDLLDCLDVDEDEGL